MIFRVAANSQYQVGVRLPVRLLNDDGTPAVGVSGVDDITADLYFANGDHLTLEFDDGENGTNIELVEADEQNGFYYISIEASDAVTIFTKERTGPFSWVVVPVELGS